MTNRKIEYWVIPPEADAEFAACMEEVIETYSTPYDPACPVLCMDEQPVQLLKETRTPIRPRRSTAGGLTTSTNGPGPRTSLCLQNRSRDGRSHGPPDENETRLGRRNGPAAGRSLRTLRESDPCVRQPEHSHERSLLRGVQTRTARQLVRRIEFRHTPKHGSWLNIAENELSSLTRQCVAGRRFGDIDTLREETSSWSTDVNKTQRGVDWQMKIDDARSKLTSLYPKIKK